jgi:hypothetical protein
VRRLLAEATGNDARKLEVRDAELVKRGGGCLLDLPQEGVVVRSHEGRVASKGLIQHDRERPDINGRADVLIAAGLFRGHIVRATRDVACACQLLLRIIAVALNDAEVDHLRLDPSLVVGNENVVGLDVAMDDAFFVGKTQSVRDRQQELNKAGGRDSPVARDDGGEAAAPQ